MAWTISTYAGTYMGGKPSNARTAMFELCRAVNEREDAVGTAKTQFYKADGTLAADLTMADLENLPCAGANSLAEQNLLKIRNRLVTLSNSGWFSVSSGVSAAYTQASLEAAAGIDLSDAPTRVQDAAMWQGYQDALDLLIYARIIGTVTAAGQRYVISGTHTTDPETAWDNMLADTETSDSVPLVPLIGYSLSEPLNVWSAGSVRKYEGFTANAINLDGVLQGIEYRINRSLVSNSASGLSIDVDIGKASPTSDTIDADDDGYIYITGDKDDFSLSSNTTGIDFERTSSLPTDVPFAIISVPNGPLGDFRVYVDGIVHYFDIAGELSDQA